MITILGIMDKLYSDTKALAIVYFVGTGLLLLFIVMLAFSLRKKDTPKNVDKKEEINNIDEAKNISLFDNDKKKEEVSVKEEVKEPSVEELDTTMDTQVELNSLEESRNEDETPESLIEATQKLNITPMTFNNDSINNEIIEPVKETINTVEEAVPETETTNSVDNNINFVEENHVDKGTLTSDTPESVNISTDIPDVDSFVDKVVNKTVEKNEQFSSIFVGDKTSTMKLDTVLDKLNVDKDIKEDIIPKDIIPDKEENINDKPIVSSLDDLKKSLDIKKEEIISKEEELKNKLNSLKNTSSSIELPKMND